MRRLILVIVVLVACAGTGACQKTPTTNDSDRREQVPSDDAARSAADDLYRKWAAGHFKRVSATGIRPAMNKYMQVRDGAGLSADSMESLRKTLASFLAAYASTDFGKYLAFRDPATMAGSDHPLLRQRIDALSRGWSSNAGDSPPTDALGVMRVVWHMYIEGGMPGMGGGPVIEKVKWSSCRLRTDRLSVKEIRPDEWDQVPGTKSHFARRLNGSSLGAITFVELENAVPNHIAVAEIAARDGVVVFADFEIVLKTANLPPHPLIVRFVHDPRTTRWLPLNAAKIVNEPPHMFVW